MAEVRGSPSFLPRSRRASFILQFGDKLGLASALHLVPWSPRSDWAGQDFRMFPRPALSWGFAPNLPRTWRTDPAPTLYISPSIANSDARGSAPGSECRARHWPACTLCCAGACADARSAAVAMRRWAGVASSSMAGSLHHLASVLKHAPMATGDSRRCAPPGLPLRTGINFCRMLVTRLQPARHQGGYRSIMSCAWRYRDSRQSEK